MSHPRDQAEARLAAWLADPTGWLAVWGMPGIGKSHLVRTLVSTGWAFQDARHADELVRDGPVVWDGASATRAREALAAGTRGPVLITCRERPDLEEERSIELGPLSASAGADVLERELARRGHTLDEEARHRISTALDGVPLALVRAARWLDVVGVDGLVSIDGVRWTGPMDAAPHLRSLGTALQDDWTGLTDDERHALVRLSPVGSIITPDLAEALLGEPAYERVRRLRDRSWVHAEHAGSLRILGVVRSFVRALADAPSLARANADLDTFLLERAAAAWPALDRRGAPLGELGLWLDELAVAIARASERADEAGLIGGISLLSVLRPGLPAVRDSLERAAARGVVHPRPGPGGLAGEPGRRLHGRGGGEPTSRTAAMR